MGERSIMATQPNKYHDLLVMIPDWNLCADWFDTKDWRGWQSATDENARGFAPGVVASQQRGATYLLRMTQADYEALLRLSPPKRQFDIMANADPYASLGTLDPESPTYNDDVLALRSCFHKIKSNATKVAVIRDNYPLKQTRVVDDTLRTEIIDAPLNFADFGERVPGAFGEGET